MTGAGFQVEFEPKLLTGGELLRGLGQFIQATLGLSKAWANDEVPLRLVEILPGGGLAQGDSHVLDHHSAVLPLRRDLPHGEGWNDLGGERFLRVVSLAKAASAPLRYTIGTGQCPQWKRAACDDQVRLDHGDLLQQASIPGHKFWLDVASVELHVACCPSFDRHCHEALDPPSRRT